MFVIHEDMTIYATRGDAVYFQLEKKNGEFKYKFQPGDIVRFKVFGKKNCGKVVLMKDFVVEEESTSVNIFLDKKDTKFGDIISKPVDYWWEAELNPDTFPDTFIGYDEDGAKLFRLYPEAKDVVEGEIDDPEENSAVARMVVTFVNEYLGENAEDTIVKTIDQYFAEHPVKDGKDGFTPIAKVTETDSGAVITITDAEGTTEATVKNGKDGHTPVKGEDYYTEAEKDALVQDVLDQIPAGGGTVTSVNGVQPDENGNVQIETGVTPEEVLEALPAVTAVDFSAFDRGSFTETVDGEVVTHSVTFDEQGRPSKIDDIVITWGDA
jgi:hypothetical protein